MNMLFVRESVDNVAVELLENLLKCLHKVENVSVLCMFSDTGSLV